MKYCSHCAGALQERVPPGEDRPRMVCSQCDRVHYLNPLPVVGCVVERGDEVLLCKRAIEPAYGRWTTPAGFLEIGEGMIAGAARETMEEACAEVDIVAPHAYFDLPHIGQTYALFRARMRSPYFDAGTESLETAFVHVDDIPWSEIAFPAVHFALQLLLEDRALAVTRLHTAVLQWSGNGSGYDPGSYALVDHLRLPFQPAAE